jgi:hypothetical protein
VNAHRGDPDRPPWVALVVASALLVALVVVWVVAGLVGP